MTLPVTLTVRGTYLPPTLDAMRSLHNDTAGAPQGMAAARSLGDLSHKVFSPCAEFKNNGAVAGELLFLDVWVEAAGIGQFFSNPEVQKQGAGLFKHKDPTVWMHATGALSYHLPSQKRTGDKRHVGMIRGPIASPEAAIAAFVAADAKDLRNARLRGIVSHEIFIKLAAPGEPLELLGLDVWSSYEGLAEHYADTTHNHLRGPAFTGKPAASVWEEAPGAWNEW